MKIIDLLNKIANGEEVPKKIKYNDVIWEYNGNYLFYFSYCFPDDIWLDDHYDIPQILNDTVEILEEENKIPEKLDVIAYDKCIHEVTHKEKQLALEIRETQIAFNEIIDYLKSKGDE